MSTLTETHHPNPHRASVLVARTLRALAAPAAFTALACLFYWKLVFAGLILASYDLFTYFYPFKAYTAAAIAANRLPLWNPDSFMGVPFLANIQTAVLYPPNLADLVLVPPIAVTVSIVSHVVLAGLFTYVFLHHSVSLSRRSAFLGGVVFMFSGFLGQQVGHINQLNASIWLPLLLASFDWAHRTRSLRRALIAGVILAFALLAGHSQESFLIGVIFAAYVGFRLVLMPEVGRTRSDSRRSSAQLSERHSERSVAQPSERRTGHPDSQFPECQSHHPQPQLPECDVDGTQPYSPECHPEPQRRISPFAVVGSNVPAETAASSSLQQGDPSLRLRMTIGRMCRGAAGIAALHSRLFLVAASVIVLAVGAGLAAMQLLPTYELSKESIRSGGLPYAEAISFSLSPLMLARSLLPGYLSNPFSEYIGYVGVAPLLMAILALIARPRDRFVWFALSVAMAAVVLAMGGYDPYYHILYNRVPGFNLFRVPARWLYAYTFAVSMLVGLGADALLRARGPNGPSLRSRMRTLLLFLAVLSILGAVLWVLRRPLLPPTRETPLLWLLFGGLGLLLITAGLWRVRGSWLAVPLSCLFFGELLFAAQGLDLNQPLPLETYTTLPSSVAQLLSRAGNDRILSISPGEFAPGDEPEVNHMLAGTLPSHQIMAFLITLKYSQTLAPNVPMRFGLASMDGYDGGVLPLKRYAQLKQMIAKQVGGGATPADQADAPLRQQLARLPDSSLLGMMGVKYVLADKLNDLVQDGIYYDLALPATSAAGSAAVFDGASGLRATSLRLLSHVEPDVSVAPGDEIARLVVQAEDGDTQVLPIRAGMETGWFAPSNSGPLSDLSNASVVDLTAGQTYLSSLRFTAPTSVRQVRVEFTAASGKLWIEAISFVDDRLGLSEPSASNGAYRRIYSGDVKIYENLDARERLSLVPHAYIGNSDAETLDLLTRHATDGLVLSDVPGAEWQAIITKNADAPAANPPSPTGSVRLLVDRPELRSAAVTTEQPAFLLFAESFFPGWQARVDGQPAQLARANHLFQAIYIPAGSHVVDFVYNPRSVRLGWAVSGAALALVAGALCLGAVRRLGRRKRNANA